MSGAGGSEDGGARVPLTVRLTQLGRDAGAGLRRRLEPLGLDTRQYRVLSAVATLGGCSQRALTARLGIPPSRVVAILDALEGRGLVERRNRPGDRRSYALVLTPAGRDLLERAGALVQEVDMELLGGLADSDRDALEALVARVVANCRRC